MPTRILLVDDEFLALRLLEDYATRLPGLEVVAKAKTALQAMEILAAEPIDIMFLDIQMPVLSGVNLLKALPRRPVTIFTTAYSEYALDAFDLNVVDYLLKPYSFERFVQAVHKALDALPKSAENTDVLPENAYIVVKVDGRLEKIALEELLYVEGLSEYVRLVCAQKQCVTFERMKHIEARLPAAQFLRVHKSWIVAKRAVQSLEGNLLHVGKVKIPVSRERKEAVVAAIFGV
jgi:two-component system, LytTR family, response regulator LytT